MHFLPLLNQPFNLLDNPITSSRWVLITTAFHAIEFLCLSTTFYDESKQEKIETENHENTLIFIEHVGNGVGN